MVWAVRSHLGRGKRIRVWGGVFLCWLCLMLLTPKIRHPPNLHLFADMRHAQFFRSSQHLECLLQFPIFGHRRYWFCPVSPGQFLSRKFTSRLEILGWALFYAGIAAVAFGSAYYHLNPDDNGVMWDSLLNGSMILGCR